MLRSPAVAGHFYKSSPEALKKQVEGFIISGSVKRRAVGVVVPHAGLIYSGAVAGAVYSSIELPDTLVLIGPNHTGLGSSVSLMAKGSWETPLGVAEIDEALAASILSRSPRIHDDALAHLREHSLEVQLPFIQYFKKKFKIVPIQMLDTRLETCLEVGRAVAEAIKERKERGEKSERRTEEVSAISNNKAESRDVLIVASSDMSHYEPAARAKEKDSKAINSILNLDPEGLYHVVRDYEITMCGFGPTVAMLVAGKLLGATNAALIKYSNSGETSGDYDRVVGYAGIVVT
jgi:predicted class III extradiol MEMO1 family dioxygenase